MTPEERELLTQSIRLSEENNKMLRSMRRGARFASFLRIIYWLIILGSAFSAWYFLEPYINSMRQDIQTVKDTTVKITSPSTWFNNKQ